MNLKWEINPELSTVKHNNHNYRSQMSHDEVVGEVGTGCQNKIMHSMQGFRFLLILI